MTDTIRNQSTLQTIFATNGVGAITAQNLRDFVVSSLLFPLPVSGTDTAGNNLIVPGGQGTGAGTGGSILFKTAPAGSTGSSQNALVTALTIDSSQNATFGGSTVTIGASGFGNGKGLMTEGGIAIGAGSIAGGIAGNQINLYSGGSNLASINSVGFQLNSTGAFTLGSTGPSTADTYITRRTTANLQLGAADSATPVAQTLSVQSVVTGTSNTGGVNFTICGSQSTGTANGGWIIFKTCAGASTGSTPNPLLTALTIDSSQTSTFAGNIYTTSSAGYLGINDTHGIQLNCTGQNGYWVGLNGNKGAFVGNNTALGFSSTTSQSGIATYITSPNTATIQHGAADAASPIAQTLQVQNVVAGTTNTAGVNFTINGSQGTGTGAGGSIILQIAPAGTTGSTQNALVAVLTIDNSQNTTFSGNITIETNRLYGTSGTWVTPAASSGLTTNANILTLGSGAFNSTIILEAASIWSLRNGTNAQEFRAYGTYTSSTSYERCVLRTGTTGTSVIFGTEKGSGGGAACGLTIQTNGTAALTINASQVTTFSAAMTVNNNFTSTGTIKSSSGYLINSANHTSGYLLPSWGTNFFGMYQPSTTTASLGWGSGTTLGNAVLTWDDSNNATFAGTIVSNNGSGFGIQLGNYGFVGGGSTIIGFASGVVGATTTADAILSRGGAANIRHGAADAASPIAQTLSVQNVVTGTTNTAGVNFTINGSQGTGTGAGGSIIFQTAPAGTTGSTQNALVSALTIDSSQKATFAGTISNYNGIATAGNGVMLIVASASLTAQAASITSLCAYTVGAADALFQITGHVSVTSGTTYTIAITATFTDDTNTSRTQQFYMSGVTATATIGLSNAAIGYYGFIQNIRAKSATVITVKTTVTGTTAYNVSAVIQQMS